MGLNKRNNGWPAYKCIKILYSADIIDDGLKGEINKVRKHRNNEVHNIRRWIFANYGYGSKYNNNEIKDAINSGDRSVIRIIEIATEIDLEP